MGSFLVCPGPRAVISWKLGFYLTCPEAAPRTTRQWCHLIFCFAGVVSARSLGSSSSEERLLPSVLLGILWLQGGRLCCHLGPAPGV